MLDYLKIYQKYTGRKIYVIFGLTFFAIILDGFGITLLLPVLDAVLGSAGGATEFPVGSVLEKVDVLISTLTQTISNVLLLDNPTSSLFILIILVFFLKGLLLFTATGLNSIFRAQYLSTVKLTLLKQTTDLNYEYFAKANSGHFVNLINEQAFRSMQCFFNLTQATSQFVSTLVYIFIAFMISMQFSLIMLLTGIIVFFLYKKINTVTQKLSIDLVSEKDFFVSKLLELFQNYLYLKSTGLHRKLNKPIQNSIQRISRTQSLLGLAGAATKSSQEFISIAIIMLVMLTYSIVDPGKLPELLLSVMLLYRAVSTVMAYQTSWQTTLETIGSILEIDREVNNLSVNSQPQGKERGAKTENYHAVIHMKNLSYEISGKKILQNITLEFLENKSYALVGKSGSGKTTLARILTGVIRHSQGELLFDNHNPSILDMQSWTKQIGYISQDSAIFDGSVLYNIILDDINYSSLLPHEKTKIDNLLKVVKLNDVVGTLPFGLDTRVGERGANFSGGQKQRLFLARELYRDPKLLILDEATSALDEETESFIQNEIKKMIGTRTLIIIAHRLKTIKDCEEVIMLQDGYVKDLGGYQDLARKHLDFFRDVE